MSLLPPLLPYHLRCLWCPRWMAAWGPPGPPPRWWSSWPVSVCTGARVGPGTVSLCSTWVSTAVHSTQGIYSWGKAAHRQHRQHWYLYICSWGKLLANRLLFHIALQIHWKLKILVGTVNFVKSWWNYYNTHYTIVPSHKEVKSIFFIATLGPVERPILPQ